MYLQNEDIYILKNILKKPKPDKLISHRLVMERASLAWMPVLTVLVSLFE